MALAEIRTILKGTSDIQVRFLPNIGSTPSLRLSRQAECQATCHLFRAISREKMRFVGNRHPELPRHAALAAERAIPPVDFAWDLGHRLYHNVDRMFQILDILTPFQWKESIRSRFREDFNTARDDGNKRVFDEILEELDQLLQEAERQRRLHLHTIHSPSARCPIPARMNVQTGTARD